MASVPGISGQNMNEYRYDQEGDPQIGIGAQGNVYSGNEKRHHTPSANTTNYGYNQPPRNQPPPYTGYMSGPNMGYPPAINNNNMNVVVAQPVANTIIIYSRPTDYLFLSIFMCLCCCFPLGIIAIIFSCKSASASDRMDYVKARSDATVARNVNIAAIFAASAIYIILVIVLKSGVTVSSRSYYDQDGVY